MKLQVEKVNDKLDLDVEAQWNCNSSKHCKTKKYTNKASDASKPAGGAAITVNSCNKTFVGTVYSTSGWSIF